jgi:hypothetical protein
MLDQGNRIISSNKQAMEQLTAITEQASNAQHDVA